MSNEVSEFTGNIRFGLKREHIGCRIAEQGKIADWEQSWTLVRTAQTGESSLPIRAINLRTFSALRRI